MQNDLPIITHVEFFKTDYERRPPVSVGGRPFCSLTIRKSGTTLIKAGGSTFSSTPDTLTFIPAGCPYVTEIPEGLLSTVPVTAGTECRVQNAE